MKGIGSCLNILKHFKLVTILKILCFREYKYQGGIMKILVVCSKIMDLSTIFCAVIRDFHVINMILMWNWDRKKKIKILLFTCAH